MRKYRIGLDVGPSSIGWSILEYEVIGDKWIFKRIVKTGSRIIPMDAGRSNAFMTGQSVTRTAERTAYRQMRRLNSRFRDRRARLHRVLSLMGFLPDHFASCINQYGKIVSDPRPQIAWKPIGNGKHEFLFKDSYEEMKQELVSRREVVSESTSIPHNWTIYYLRKKALVQAITKEEIAWILLQANQKRGYNSSRSQQAADQSEGMNDKELSDYMELKKHTEATLENSNQTVGEYIYDNLLSIPDLKVKGKLIQTIDRNYYKKEILQILNSQARFHAELLNKDLLQKCASILYSKNTVHRRNLCRKSMIHLIVEDILYYQRNLKKKKHLIADCPYETYDAVDKETGEIVTYGTKCIARSNPLFQEFRILQLASNLRLLRIDPDKEVDVTKEHFDKVDFKDHFVAYANMEDLFHGKKSPKPAALTKRSTLKEGEFLSKVCGIKKDQLSKYRWNYPSDAVLKLNETRSVILSALLKSESPEKVSLDMLTKKYKGVTAEELIWNILYSQDDQAKCQEGLATLLKNMGYKEYKEYSRLLANCKPFEQDFGSYSAKALKKVLPLMRIGKTWSATAFSPEQIERFVDYVANKLDEKKRNRLKEEFPARKFDNVEDFQGLPLWITCYLTYNRYSEAKSNVCWKSPEDITNFIKGFQHNSLNNPIVETSVLEALRVVRDIMKEYEISQINLEIAREMKANAIERKRISEQITLNTKRRLRAMAMIREIRETQNQQIKSTVADPESAMQIERMIIYEDQVLGSTRYNLNDNEKELVRKMQKFSPRDCDDAQSEGSNSYISSRDIEKYLLWLDQKYVSPYTGETIPLSRLFTSDYEREHIIPQSKRTDNSFHNKVLAESAVNRLKSDHLGMSFIREHAGEEVSIGFNRTVRILSEDSYRTRVQNNYSYDRIKQKNLLLEEIPGNFTSRDLNNTRYIARLLSQLLSNVVRDEQDDNGPTSKNLLVIQGGITARLKKEWGLGAVWNALMLPRFERMNRIHNTNEYIAVTTNGYRIPTVPLRYMESFELKRIDHRHHALDAIIIGCTERSVVQFLNTMSGLDQDSKTNYYALRNSVCRRKGKDELGDRWIIKKPTDGHDGVDLCVMVREALTNCRVSFKRNLRTFYYRKDPVTGKKHPAVYLQLHDETIYGEVQLQRNGVVDTAYATRKPLNDTFSQSLIKQVTDVGIQSILLKHLARYDNQAKKAFSPEGIDELNSTIKELNGDKDHKPIHRVRISQKMNQFAIGNSGDKLKKFAKAAKGTNLFLAIYESIACDANGLKKREFKTITLRDIMVAQVNRVSPFSAPSEDYKLLFVLTVGDIVYMPRPDEHVESLNTETLDNNRLYRFVSSSYGVGLFVPYLVSNSIVDKKEFTNNNKSSLDMEQRNIQRFCIKLNMNRLGKIWI